MTITLTIDTHPHSNAVTAYEVKTQVGEFVQRRGLGTLIDTKAEFDPEYLLEVLHKIYDETDAGSEAETLAKEALDYLKG